jgi:hypothetical protein
LGEGARPEIGKKHTPVVESWHLLAPGSVANRCRRRSGRNSARSFKKQGFSVDHYLVSKLAGQPNKEVAISCIAVEETLAEKALSFLRRHAQHRSGNMTQAWDTALVRHIYDTYCIVQSDGSAVEKAKGHFGELVAFDVKEFTQHEAFTIAPKECLSAALALAEMEPQTKAEYRTRLLPLIYGNIKPSFSDAFAVFKTSSEALIATL